MNRIHLLGHLACDPQIRHEGGKDCAILYVYTDESYRDDQSGARTSRRVVHTVVVRRETIAKAVSTSLSSGSRVIIEGTLRYGDFGNDQEVNRNNAKIFVEAPAHQITFLDARAA